MAARWRARGWDAVVVDERVQRPLWEHIEPAPVAVRVVRADAVRAQGPAQAVALPGQIGLWGEDEVP